MHRVQVGRIKRYSRARPWLRISTRPSDPPDGSLLERLRAGVPLDGLCGNRRIDLSALGSPAWGEAPVDRVEYEGKGYRCSDLGPISLFLAGRAAMGRERGCSTGGGVEGKSATDLPTAARSRRSFEVVSSRISCPARSEKFLAPPPYFNKLVWRSRRHIRSGQVGRMRFGHETLSGFG